MTYRRTLFALMSVLLAWTGAARAATPCADLATLSMPNAKVTAAQVVEAGRFTPPAPARGGGAAAQPYAALGAFCRVSLTLTPSADSDITVEVWLPASGWNGKYQAVGAGGMAGSIPYQLLAPALAAGYAASGTDTGHVGNNADFMPAHPEKLTDFAHRAIHEMSIASKRVVDAHYGKAPAFSYYNGCSGGGRAGLANAQRHPADFDGIIAGAASWNPMRMDAARVAVNRFVNRTPASAIPASKYRMVHDAVMASCDGLDGVKDGVLENPTACTFDYASLACTAGDAPACLTAPQVESARALTSSLRHPVTGAVLFEGHLWPGAELEWDTLGGAQPLSNALIRLKNITYQDPSWDPSRFDPAVDVDYAEKRDAGVMAFNDMDLRPFFKEGGKLLMYHGWADPQVTPQNSINYFQGVLKTVGASASSSIALFMLPGVSHCDGGSGPDTFDGPAAMSQWVEPGQKPTRIIASRVRDGKVDRTRPLCAFGHVARYTGKGDTNDAANFTCVVQAINTRRR